MDYSLNLDLIHIALSAKANQVSMENKEEEERKKETKSKQETETNRKQLESMKWDDSIVMISS